MSFACKSSRPPRRSSPSGRPRRGYEAAIRTEGLQTASPSWCVRAITRGRPPGPGRRGGRLRGPAHCRARFRNADRTVYVPNGRWSVRQIRVQARVVPASAFVPGAPDRPSSPRPLGDFKRGAGAARVERPEGVGSAACFPSRSADALKDDGLGARRHLRLLTPKAASTRGGTPHALVPKNDGPAPGLHPVHEAAGRPLHGGLDRPRRAQGQARVDHRPVLATSRTTDTGPLDAAAERISWWWARARPG